MIAKILITGIPGTGKTFIGDQYQIKRGFEHINMETFRFWVIYPNPDDLIAALNNKSHDTVITWGFPSDHVHTNIIKKLKQLGWKLIWFDGDREAALKSFSERELQKQKEGIADKVAAFTTQVKAIDNNNVVQQIQPIQINPFNEKHERKEVDEVMKEIENA